MKPEEIVTMRDAQLYVIIQALNAAQGNRKVAANILQIGERTLYRYIKIYNITRKITYNSGTKIIKHYEKTK